MKSIVFKITVGCFCAVSLSACNITEPRLYNKSPELVPIIDKDEINDANYMARYLLNSGDRIKLETIARKEEIKRRASYGSVEAGIVGTTMLGNNPTSAKGVGTATDIMVGIEAADVILSMLGPDGSLERVSKIYIPEKIGDITINSIEEANQFARNYTHKKISNFSKQENRSLECIYGCNENVTIYKLIKKGFTGDEPYDALKRGAKIHEGKYYDPPKLFVLTVETDLVSSKADPVRDRILGFSPKWESMYENGWRAFIAGDFVRDEKGNIKFRDDKFTNKVPLGWYKATGSPIDRRFSRTLTGGDNLIYLGRRDVLGKQFSMKGKVFEFSIRYWYRFMEHEISPESDVVDTKISVVK